MYVGTYLFFKQTSSIKFALLSQWHYAQALQAHDLLVILSYYIINIIQTRLKNGFQSKITSRVSTIGFNWILFNWILFNWIQLDFMQLIQLDFIQLDSIGFKLDSIHLWSLESIFCHDTFRLRVEFSKTQQRVNKI